MVEETIVDKLIDSSEHSNVDTLEIVDYAIGQILMCNGNQIAQSEVLTNLLNIRKGLIRKPSRR